MIFSTPFAINPWNCVVCCHAFVLNYLLCVLGVLGAVGTWFSRFRSQNCEFCRSVMMNARLSEKDLAQARFSRAGLLKTLSSEKISLGSSQLVHLACSEKSRFK